MNKIITPGDPGWAGTPGSNLPEKMPTEFVEQIFRKTMEDVQESIEVSSNETLDVPVEDVLEKAVQTESIGQPQGPVPSYKFRRPANPKMFQMRMPQPMKAKLLEDLPKSWARKCFSELGYHGSPVKSRKEGFKEGDQVTITDTTFFLKNGQVAGVLYGFAEGQRGGFGLRQDQIAVQGPVVGQPEAQVLDNQSDPLTSEGGA